MRTSISIPDILSQKMRLQMKEQGFLSLTEYVLSLIRLDVKDVRLPVEGMPRVKIPPDPTPMINLFPQLPSQTEPPRPVPKPVTPVRPKAPPRDPTAPDPYLVYGGKCQFKSVSADNIICLHSASSKIAVAPNQTGEVPDSASFIDAYLCPDHLSHVSHSSGYFVK